MGKEDTRFRATMRQTERDSDGFSHKRSKKLKFSNSVVEFDQSTSSKRVKLPVKFFDDCRTFNHTPIPKKLRSAINQRHYDSVSPSLPRKDGMLPLKDHNKKLKVNKDEQQKSTISEFILEQLTEDEKEAIEGLLLLAENNNTNKINLKTETSNSEDLVNKDVPIEYSNKSTNIEDSNKSTNIVDVRKDRKDFREGIESRKIRCPHVYICQMIKQLQVTEGKRVNSHKEPKTNAIKESITKEATNQTSFLAGTSNQVPVPPYFGSPLYDPSQWPTPLKHQILMNPFNVGPRYHNWQKSGHEMVPSHFGSNHIQPPFINVLKSKENGSLFLDDSSPTINLRCNEHLGFDRSWLNDS